MSPSCPTTRWHVRRSPSAASASARSYEARSGASPAPGQLRLEQLRRLDALEFRHLLRWLGRALDAAADDSGTRRAESQDGLVRLELRPPAEPTRLVEIATPEGTLAAPNYEIEVIAC